MSKQYRCSECGKVVRVAETNEVKFGPFCGSSEIYSDNEKARRTANKLIEECKELEKQILPAYEKYVELNAQYQLKIRLLQSYALRRVIPKEMIPHLDKAKLDDAIKKIRSEKSKKENE